MSVSVICCDELFDLSDCDTFKNYMYAISELGDLKREFIISGDMKCVYHRDLETHKKENIREIITEYMGSYCNYTIEVVE